MLTVSYKLQTLSSWLLHGYTLPAENLCGTRLERGHTYRQTDRQADRQAGRQANRQTYTHTYIHTYIQTYIHTQKETFCSGLSLHVYLSLHVGLYSDFLICVCIVIVIHTFRFTLATCMCLHLHPKDIRIYRYTSM